MVFTEKILAGGQLKIMRIISGKYKNRKLFFSKSDLTRPLKDRVRESILNILEHSNNLNIQIKNSSILDLYAGVGSFGLECVSRGAKKISFVEKDHCAISNLKKNINFLKVENQTELYSIDIFKFFEKSQTYKKFDIIFLDPPYKDEEFLNILKIIKKKNILNKNYIIILHREKNLNNYLEKKFNVVKSKVYGRSEIFFLKFF